jgi:hypothetical protein
MNQNRNGEEIWTVIAVTGLTLILALLWLVVRSIWLLMMGVR